MTKPSQNNNSETFENKIKNTNKHKLLKSILAASSLAAISFGGGSAFAADLDALTADFTIQAASGGAADGVPTMPDNLKDATPANANFNVDDNVKFGDAIKVTNAFVGKVGIIDFNGQAGTWVQKAVATIAEVKGAVAGSKFGTTQNITITKSDTDDLAIIVAAGKELTFAAGNQKFGSLKGVSDGSKFIFQGGIITGTIDGKTADGQGKIETTGAATTFANAIGGTYALHTINNYW